MKPIEELRAWLARLPDTDAARLLSVPVETIRAIRNGHEPSSGFVAVALATLRNDRTA